MSAGKWLIQINNPKNLGDDLFAMTNDFTTTRNLGETANFNGNITRCIWKHQSDDIERGYYFEYDNLNRLKTANYTQVNPDVTSALPTTDQFSTTYAYDQNGNINNLTRNGQLPDGTFAQIDNLSYTYANDGALTTIGETSEKERGFRSQTGNGSGDFAYDNNGNVITDVHKAMSVAYNFLDLPTQINKTEGTFAWTYDATGNKLSKTVTTNHLAVNTSPIFSKEYNATQTIESNGNVPKNGDVTFTAGQSITLKTGFVAGSGSDFLARILPNIASATREYVNGIEYFNEKIEAVYFSGGRVKYEENNTEYEYVLADNKGTVCNLFRDNGNGLAETIEDYNYYPYGSPFEQSDFLQNNYTYEGKEAQNELNLFWQDYGVRCYDAWAARWQGIDVLAESNAGHSPYSFTMGNPVSYTDPTGMISEDQDGLMQVSTDLWGSERNQDFMNRSASNAQQRAAVNQLQQAGHAAVNSNDWDWLSNGQFQRDILDTYSFGGNENQTSVETGRELLGNDIRISYSWVWVGEAKNQIADFNYNNKSKKINKVRPKLVFSGEFRGGTIGGADLISGLGLGLKVFGGLTALSGTIRVSKKTFGLRVALGGSKKALLSTVLAYKLGLRGSLGRKIPTLIPPKASSLETVLGRNAIPIGGAIFGTGYLIDKKTNGKNE